MISFIRKFIAIFPYSYDRITLPPPPPPPPPPLLLLLLLLILLLILQTYQLLPVNQAALQC